MNKEAILEQVKAQAAKAAPIGATLKFKVDNHIVYVDGTGSTNEISFEDKDAECTISTTLDVLQKLKDGKLNPMMAVMGGKVKIKGDMGVAMKLQSLLG